MIGVFNKNVNTKVEYCIFSLLFKSNIRLIMYSSLSAAVFYPTIRFNISFAKVIITPPASVKKPLALCDGSCDFSDNPICTMPNPSSIKPIALIKLKIKVERLLITAKGSLAAKAGLVPMVITITIAI